MLTLEVRINKRNNRWVDVTNDFLNANSFSIFSPRKQWRTKKGVENYIDKAMAVYPWLTRESFRINGVEEGRRKPNVRTTDIPVRVGDIFISSWGYSMTLVDFYEVTKVSKTGKSINVRKLAYEVVEGATCSPQGGRVLPVRGKYVGEELRNKRVRGDYSANPVPMFRVNEVADAYLIENIDPNGYYMCDWD